MCILIYTLCILILQLLFALHGAQDYKVEYYFEF